MHRPKSNHIIDLLLTNTSYSKNSSAQVYKDYKCRNMRSEIIIFEKLLNMHVIALMTVQILLMKTYALTISIVTFAFTGPSM